jgi:hypothetical protein
VHGGATGRILAGTYDFAVDTIKLLQGPERTVSELERLREILRAARESGASPQKVRSTVQRELRSWRVVHLFLRCSQPRKPASRISLATRLRPHRTPRARSSACTRE